MAYNANMTMEMIAILQTTQIVQC